MKDSVQFIVIIALFAYIIFLQQCKQGDGGAGSQTIVMDTIISIDTIMPPPVIVKLPTQTVPPPIVVYIDSSKNIVSPSAIDTSRHLAVHQYKDSIQDENLTLYYNSLVDGQLLGQQLNYKLKVPLQITKTIEIPKPIPMPAHQLFLTASVGGSPSAFNHVAVGLELVSNRNWALGYEYNILGNSHHVRLGIQLWRQKKIKQ